ncbi:MAG: DUF4249 family protein [bacterium]
MSIFSCGKGSVEVTNASYQPQIVVEGYLIAGRNVDNIHITQNFRLDANLRNTILVIDHAEVTITDENTGQSYPLTFQDSPFPPSDPKYNRLNQAHYRYTGNDLIVGYGKSYTLDVRAVVEGKPLHTRARTTVPNAGFRIAAVNHDSLQYRQQGFNGEVLQFQLTLERSSGSDFYVAALRPKTASTENFIYDNPYSEEDPESVEENFGDFTNSVLWIQDTPLTAGQSLFDIFWWELWFYSEYELVAYAADKNYRDFLQTYQDVQEEDGNFHEAKFHLEGDGIGVFGAVVADTVRVKVLK